MDKEFSKETSHSTLGFKKVLFIFFLTVPLVSLGYYWGKLFLESENKIEIDVLPYDYRDIYAEHLQFRLWWGTDDFLLFKTKKYYSGVLKYERPSVLDEKYTAIDLLSPFFLKLNNKKNQIRIAYYGDSGVEADLVTQTLRDSLQKMFGGSGVGFMPIMSRDPGYRKSINHYFSSLWRWESLENPKRMNHYPGISGNTFYTIQNDSLADQTAWLSYKGKAFSPRTKWLPGMRFFYGKNEQPGSNGNIYVEINENTISNDLSEKNELLNEITFSASQMSQVRIKANIPPSLPVYGISFESKTGIILDNFALRGIDGSRLTSIPVGLLKEFQKKLEYDLLVFSYGLNVINPTRRDFTEYEKKIILLVKHFRKAFPEVPILLIGPPDKAYGNPGNMISDPSIPRITKAMRIAAIKSETAFISLYELMGGKGSMIEWVEKKRPKLASSDYTHFNHEGADIISQKIFKVLIDGSKSPKIIDSQ